MRTGVLAASLALLAVVVVGFGYVFTHPFVFAKAIPTDQGTISPVGLPVDGISCDRGESLNYHIHQHLALYDNGRSVMVPAAVGIPGGESLFATMCLYWVHTHEATPGIIHVESPTRRIYTLGSFFDIWAVTKDWAVPPGDRFVVDLRRSHDVTVFVDGRRWTAGYRTVPLTAHAVITVEIGTPIVPPSPFNNWQGL